MIESYNQYIRPEFDFKIGDWVNITSELKGDVEYIQDLEYFRFLDKNIGIIVNYDRVRVVVRYYDIPPTISIYFHKGEKSFKISRIVDYDSDKKDLEDRLKMRENVKKYNL